MENGRGIQAEARCDAEEVIGLDVMSAQLQQGPLNAVAWILVLAGAVAFVSATVGLVLVATAVSRHASTAVSEELHGSYYVVRHTTVWPFIVLMLLSALVTVGGYVHTDRFANHLVRRHVEVSQ